MNRTMIRAMIRAMIRVTMLTVVGLALWGLSPAELGLAPVAAQGPDALAAPAAWAATDDVALRAETLAWLEQQELDDSVRGQASALWPESADGVLETAPPTATETDLLDRLVETFAMADPRARQLVDTCREPFSTGAAAAAEDWLYAEDTSPFVSANLRVYRGRWLAHQLLFDEARAELEGLTPDDVAAPATLLFYQAVAYHRLLDREAGLKVIKQLLDGEDQSPRRYTALARLMQQDLRGLKDDSLDHIARRMDDIERRLALGRAGAKVRGIEDGVIESLDKLIEELEQQQQQSSSPGASNQSSSPLQDSRLMGGGGPGRVDKKDIGSKSGWGDLPQKEREQAMQQIGREFPAHYRDIIEQYFRNRAGSSGG